MAYQATFVDLQTSVADKLRLDIVNDAAMLARVKVWINQVYMQACTETQGKETFCQLTLTAGVSSYTMPSDVWEINQMVLTPASDSVPGGPLECVTLGDLLTRRAGSPSGSPTCYAMVGETDYEVSPIPDAADTLTVWYVAKPSKLITDTDTPFLPEPYGSKLIEYGALAEGADYKLDPRREEYRQIYEQWLARYRIHLRRRGGGVALQIPRYRQTSLVPHTPSTDTRYW
jgi:hypothetical protein